MKKKKSLSGRGMRRHANFGMQIYCLFFFFYCFVLRYILFPILFNLTAFLSRLLIFFLLYTWDSIKYNPSFNFFWGGNPHPKAAPFDMNATYEGMRYCFKAKDVEQAATATIGVETTR